MSKKQVVKTVRSVFPYFCTMRGILLLFICLFGYTATAQRTGLQAGEIRGTVTDALNNRGLANVSVSLAGKPNTTTDSLGRFVIGQLKPGYYTIELALVGYKKQNVADIAVTNSRPAVITASLEGEIAALGEVKIRAPLFLKPLESPISLRTLGVAEIKRNPGANRDISKVIQSLPGVATQVSFRNDIIIRGGAPNENRFFLDGIEIPNINHFSTQGSSGGPVGLINVDFIKDVNFYSGAFPASRGNSLSSVFEFTQRDGKSDKMGASLTVGASDLAAVVEGPIGSKTTYLASYRYSYLQGLFKLLQLPFLPAYQDFQFKVKTRFNARNELTLIGIGAIDRFKLNFNAEKTAENLYTLANIPVNGQNNYAVGATYKNYRENGFSTWVISRNFLDNSAIKYQDNDPAKTKTIDYTSQETENKLRYENVNRYGAIKLSYGAGLETALYTTNTLGRAPIDPVIYRSRLQFEKYSFFAKGSTTTANNRLNLSFGLRGDGATYSSRTQNPLKTLSPRLSAAFTLSDRWSINASTGRYYQLPAYTLLGYRLSDDAPLYNKDVGYIRADHAVLGLEYNPGSSTRFTLEGFFKHYARYPMLRLFGDTVPLANLGGDFGVVGNRPVAGYSKGRSYGIELLAQRRATQGFYGIAAVTLFKSEFLDKRGSFVQSAWNSRFIVSLTGGKVFQRNWEAGARFRFSGGSPYTPYDQPLSSLRSNYTIYPQGIPDFDRLNTDRLASFYQVDLRIDKKYPFRKFNLNFYIDVQNVTYNKYELQASLNAERDPSGALVADPADPTRVKTFLLKNESGNILPTIGVIVEF